MPSSSEFQELIGGCDIIDAEGNIIEGTDKRTTMYGVVGLRLRSRVNGNVIFFPASGYGGGAAWSSRGSYGFYWSSSWGSARTAWDLIFGPSGMSPHDTYNRYSGFPVRPVIDTASP